MPLPLIGLTISRYTDDVSTSQLSMPEAYAQAITKAGGVPLLIPLGLTEDALQRIITRIDGILFTGGGDIHPERYGGAMSNQCQSVDADRDRIEIFLLRQIIQAPKPFLGICRGCHIINVGLGGSLYIDISTDRPKSLEHRRSRRDVLAHPVRIKEGSQLAKIIGAEEIEVNSRHHQAIQKLAAGLTAVAFAPDGVLEAIEMPDYSGFFGLGVQWQPEDMLEHKPARDLFRAFIQTARDISF
jgi:putative glutamine amidotransferase